MVKKCSEIIVSGFMGFSVGVMRESMYVCTCVDVCMWVCRCIYMGMRMYICMYVCM